MANLGFRFQFQIQASRDPDPLWIWIHLKVWILSVSRSRTRIIQSKDISCYTIFFVYGLIGSVENIFACTLRGIKGTTPFLSRTVAHGPLLLNGFEIARRSNMTYLTLISVASINRPVYGGGIRDQRRPFVCLSVFHFLSLPLSNHCGCAVQPVLCDTTRTSNGGSKEQQTRLTISWVRELIHLLVS